LEVATKNSEAGERKKAMVERGKPIYDRRKDSAKQEDPKSRPMKKQEWKSAVLSAQRESVIAAAEAEIKSAEEY